jgi:chromate transporter
MKTKKLAVLFLEMLKISAFTFGGGFVIIPLLRRIFVENRKWIGEEEMMDLTAIAQSAPGPIAVNAAILTGYRVAGVPGAAISVLGTVIPPLVILSVISLFYNAFRENRYVNILMAGMLCGVAAVILNVVLDLLRVLFSSGKKADSRGEKGISLILLMGAFVANRYFGVPIILIILVCGLLGLLLYFLKKSGKEGEDETLS